MRTLLNTIQVHIIIQWILGHLNIPDNDLADRAAKQATGLPPSVDLVIAFSSALNVIKNVIRDLAIAHDQMRKIQTNYRPSIDNVQITTQADKVLIARLRSGHHPALRAYLHRLDSNIDPICSTCKDKDHTLHHWLITCSTGHQLRQKLFGCSRGRLEWLTTGPKAVVAYIRKTLVYLDV